MTEYIGLDGHCKTCTLVTLDETARLTRQAHIPTTESTLLSYVRQHVGPVKLMVEESHLSQWFYLLLKDEVDELVVCNPRYIGKKVGPKGDLEDAKHLANELRCGHFVATYHEDTPLWSLRSLVSAYLDVVRQLVQSKNRYKALFCSEAIGVSGQAIYTDRERIKELSRRSDQFVAEKLFEAIAHLESVRESYVDEFGAYAKRHRQIKRLCSIPGLSIVRASIITAIVCSPERFANKHKFWAYCMLVRYVDESDGVTYSKRRIQGRTELKAVFDGAALAALRGSSSLRVYYDELRLKGVAHRNAKKAVARRIAAISLAILKRTDSKFDNNYQEKIVRPKKQTKKIVSLIHP